MTHQPSHGAIVDTPTGYESAAEAFRMFNRWCAEHDPEGALEIDQAAIAYFEWSNQNSVEKYTDRACGYTGHSETQGNGS